MPPALHNARVRVTALYVYPVKGCGGVAVDAAVATARGLDGDRRWMVTDDSGRFVTQREHPRLALVRCELRADALALRAPGVADCVLPRAATGGARVDVTVWGDRVAARADAAGGAFFSAVLGQPCRAVYMPDDQARGSFADAYPFLLATEASLAELNRRLPAPIPMRRFRPNIVVTGTEPFAEDAWRDLAIAGARFDLPKGCDRCSVTTVDPDTAETGPEPLRTLATFRKRDGKVWFGMNLALRDGGGRLRVGDAVIAA